MNIEKMREEFEAALIAREVVRLKEKAPGLSDDSAEAIARSIFLERKGDGYAAVVPDHAWWSWKASRDVLVIEMPDEMEMYNDFGWSRGLERCREQIEATGVKVSP